MLSPTVALVFVASLAIRFASMAVADDSSPDHFGHNLQHYVPDWAPSSNFQKVIPDHMVGTLIPNVRRDIDESNDAEAMSDTSARLHRATEELIRPHKERSYEGVVFRHKTNGGRSKLERELHACVRVRTKQQRKASNRRQGRVVKGTPNNLAALASMSAGAQKSVVVLCTRAAVATRNSSNSQTWTQTQA